MGEFYLLGEFDLLFCRSDSVERFWAWLRKTLRTRDLADAVAGRPALGKPAWRARVKRVIQSRRAQAVASNCAKSMRKVCREVVKQKGAATKC